MEANELRVNNWIIEPGQDENKPFQIFSIYHETGNNKVNGLPINYFKPIPLTEDWLIRFGFEKYEGGYMVKTYYVGVYLHLRKDIFNELVCTLRFYGKQKEDNQWMPLSPFLKHVHQLQNLYFSLTGTELTLKN